MKNKLFIFDYIFGPNPNFFSLLNKNKNKKNKFISKIKIKINKIKIKNE